MKKRTKLLAAALGLILFSVGSAMSSADTVYFLVGVRHVYRIGPDKDLHMQEREEIEKNYADGVAADQDVFNKHVADGADSRKESDLLDSDLQKLSDARDASLGSIFDRCDEMREQHPELKVQVDGPYQVVGLEMHTQGTTEVIDRCAVFAPWPDYVAVGGCYGGWTYGVWYDPFVFWDLYLGWFSVYPGGFFWGGFWGHHGLVSFGPHGYVGHFGGFGRGGGFGHGGGFSHGGGYVRAGGGFGQGYTHSGYSAGRSSAYSHSGYTHSVSSSTGYSHSGATRSSAGGYSHGSSFGHSGTSYTHSTSTGRYSGSGGYSRASGGYRSSTGASGGSTYSRSYAGSSRGTSGLGGSSHVSSSRGGGSGHSGGGSGGRRAGR